MGTTQNALPDFCRAGYFCHKVLTGGEASGARLWYPGGGMSFHLLHNTSYSTALY